MEAVFLHPGEVAFIVHLESDTSTRKPLKAKQTGDLGVRPRSRPIFVS